MSQPRLTYNPSLLTEQELVDSFVVRTVDLELILETIRDNDGESNQHVVIVGPRGAGKTTLVERVAIALKGEPTLEERWTPLLFGEESYEVGSVGELWLKALQKLAETCPQESRWQQAFAAIREERDEERLRERALGRLLDYAEEHGRRLVLIIENLDMILGEQIEADQAWVLRHTLQQRPELMLLATATHYERIFGQQDLPLYGLAREHRLEPLTLGETRELWAHVAGQERSERAMIPLHRLTGGNPRLVTIVASFSAGRSLRELMDELTALVDEHTTYFKAVVEGLPPTERRVYVTLADLWAPATSRQVAERCRMTPSKASALIARLVSRGVVEEVGKEGRNKRYQLAERLYNVYHLLRSGSGTQKARLRGLVEFMAMFYESDELVQMMGRLAVEAEGLPDHERGDHFEAYSLLMDKVINQRRLLDVTPAGFLRRLFELKYPDQEPMPVEMMIAVARLMDSVGEVDVEDAKRIIEEYFGDRAYDVVRSMLEDPQPFVEDGGAESSSLLSFFVRIFGMLAKPGEGIGLLQRLVEALPRGMNPDPLKCLIVCLGRVGRLDDALARARELTEAFAADSGAWALLGQVQESRGEVVDAAAAYRRSLALSDDPRVRLRLATVLYEIPGRADEARELSESVAFEEGEPPRWLRVAQAEQDPDRASAIAKKLLEVADVEIAMDAIKVIVRAWGGSRRFLAILDEVPSTHAESPGAFVCLAYSCFGLLTLWHKGSDVDEESLWAAFEAFLRHPQWRRDSPYNAIMASKVVLMFGRLDQARTLNLLDALEVGPVTEPFIVALRMMLGGDVTQVPAEIVALGRDIEATMKRHL